MIKEMAKILKGFVRKKLGSTIYFLFHFCGLLYTALIITSNVMTYFKFTSNLIQTEILKSEWVKNICSFHSGLTTKIKPNYVQIPNLMVCSDSMHSKRKVEAKYPKLNKTSIQKLYGLHVKGRSMWGIRKTLPNLFSRLRDNYEKEFSVRVKSF